jgi:putative endonuclease
MIRDRSAAEQRGRRAEILALLFLSLKGYRILARRFRAAGGEIDIVARRGDLLIFAEVKARATIDAALGAVPPRAPAHRGGGAGIYRLAPAPCWPRRAL